jgi:CRP-like cAMP-binding protein
MNELMQTAACGRLHCIEQRLASWLLMCSDRVGTHQVTMTHETIAQMLGSRRATVAMHAEIMQKAGMIKYTYGRIRILSRARLERAACECYEIQRQQYATPLNN